MPVLVLDVDSCQCYLNTGVADRTDVRNHLSTTGNERELNLEEQILRGLLIDIDATIDTATEESEVDTGVVLSRGLPLQVLVDDRRGTVTRAVLVAIRIVDGVGERLLGVVILDTVTVTGHTICETEFQVAKPVEFLHERLLRDTPGCCCRGEGSPAVVLGELRTSITTDGSGQQVFALVTVVQTQGVGGHAVLGIRGLGVFCIELTRTHVPPVCAIQHLCGCPVGALAVTSLL